MQKVWLYVGIALGKNGKHGKLIVITILIVVLLFFNNNKAKYFEMLKRFYPAVIFGGIALR